MEPGLDATHNRGVQHPPTSAGVCLWLQLLHARPVYLMANGVVVGWKLVTLLGVQATNS